MSKGARSKKLSKEAILSEAKRLFSRKGYKGTTLEDLTKSFGVSRPSIYYYYKSKMEILSELHSQGFNEARVELDEILKSDLPTNEKFRKILEAHTKNLCCDFGRANNRGTIGGKGCRFYGLGRLDFR